MSAVLLDIDGERAVLTLNRPEEGNRISTMMFDALEAAISEVAERDDMRALLLRAEGPNFCVGGAINEFLNGDVPLDTKLRTDLPRMNRMIAKLAGLPFPVVSVLNGAVAGGGIGIALAADIVVAAQDTFFRAGYPGIALSPDVGGSYQVLRRAGVTFATDFFLTNRHVDAQEALSARLINAVHPVEQADAVARALLDDLATGPTRSHAAVKRLIAAQAPTPLSAHLELELEFMVSCGATEDARQAIEAFLNKQQPVFRGR